MKKTTKTMIAGAAVAGLFAGAFATQARAEMSTGATTVSTGAAPMVDAGSMLGNMAAMDSDKHDCKGKNDCKGKGGCKSNDNGCKGKNDCKGKGGCNTNKSDSN